MTKKRRLDVFTESNQERALSLDAEQCFCFVFAIAHGQTCAHVQEIAKKGALAFDSGGNHFRKSELYQKIAADLPATRRSIALKVGSSVGSKSEIALTTVYDWKASK